MDKKTALKILFSTSERYKKELCDKNLLFVTANKHNKVEMFETTFNESNFLHLTGIQRPDKTGNKISECSFGKEHSSYANEFFKKCISRRLSENDIEFSSDGKTVLKLSVLPLIVNKNLSAKMFAYYKNSKPVLYTERLLGGTRACLGFVKAKENNTYVPNTLLNQDLRTLAESYNRVIAVYRKNIKDKEYRENVYLAKKIEISNYTFPEEYCYLKAIENNIQSENNN